MSDRDRESVGRFVTRTVTRPAVEVDCSGWADTTAGGWTFGRFVTRTVTRPAVEVDCSQWEAGPMPVALEITLRLAPTTDPKRLTELAERVRAVLRDAAAEGVQFSVEERSGV